MIAFSPLWIWWDGVCVDKVGDGGEDVSEDKEVEEEERGGLAGSTTALAEEVNGMLVSTTSACGTTSVVVWGVCSAILSLCETFYTIQT